MKSKLPVLILIILTIACGKSSDSVVNPTTTGKAGSMARFAISGNTLYIVDHTSLKVFNITDASSPDSIGRTDIGIGIETIFPYKNNLFIGSQNGMHIFNIDDKLKPVKLSTYEHIFSCDPVVADDNYAYVTLRTGSTCMRALNRLDIVNISDLKNPKLETSMDMSNPHGLAINGNDLYVCDNGLKVIDVADKSDLRINKHYPSLNSYDVIHQQNNLILVGGEGLIQYRVRNDSLIEISRIAAYY